ncbi:sigma 54-interacting transcriptional regulator [Edaphobacter flagellatus]|uniref:sigma 54-interacting transcriptional regulator n=1 Tax=Edaphobacter flagellatus TaxID=1933044 RepID=UPI0021B15EE5|nr:sigma 54-interacting transcriptional regulator [Edaphobacter flagellatus]
MAVNLQWDADRFHDINGDGASGEQASIEAQLRTTANLIPGHVWYANPAGALVFVNVRIADYLGLPNDHPLRFGIDLGAEWDSHIHMLHPEDHEETRRVWSTCLRTGNGGEVAFRVRSGEGGYRWFLSRADPLRTSDGTLVCWVGINLDIEERKQAEFYLAEGQRLAHTGSWAFSAAGFDYWSLELFRIHGLDPSGNAPTKEQYLALVHPEDREFVEQQIQEMLTSHRTFDFTKRIVRSDGQIRSVRCVGAPSIENGKLKQIVGIAIDVTEHEILTQELQRREMHLAEAQALSHTGSFGWNVSTDEHFWSDETFRIFEFPRSCNITLPMILERVHPQDRLLAQTVIERASKTGEDFEHEYRLLMPNGVTKHIQVRSHALGQPSTGIEFVGAVSDITERREAEQRLQQQETELRQMLDFAPQLVAVYGPKRERLYANRIALDYAGICLEEWQRTTQRFAFVHPDDRAREEDYFNRALSAGSSFELELRLRGADGTYRWFLARSNPVRDDEGQVRRWYVTCTDIEERKRAEENLKRENFALREELNQASMFEEIVGSSEPLRKVLSQVSKVALSDSTVLILGQTGTGKELIARAIHKRSKRAGRPFIGVNCAAIPTSLAASELFGHEKGSFTGATQHRLGRFEAANGGTIFLDEVGDLPPDIQIALLRVLQEREIERVGSDKPVPVDVRVLAATHRDLDNLVSQGKFRQDLLYRLNVVPISMPSLRERATDIPILVEYFIARFGKKMGKKFQTIEKKTLKIMREYEWPGNVRELQNVIERAVTLSESDTFAVDESWLKRGPSEVPPASVALNGVLLAHEKEVIEAALARSHGRISGPTGAATKLGIPDSTLEAKIKRLGIDKYRFKSHIG